MILLAKFCLFWGHNYHKKQTTALEIPRGKGAFSLLALSLLNSLTDSSNPVRLAPGETRSGKSGDTAEWWFRRRREHLNQIVMTVYQKQQLPVQFLQFGVDNVRVTVPILRSDKDDVLKLRPAIRPASSLAKAAPSSR